MAGDWILLVAGTRRNEMIVGALSVLLTGVFLSYLYRSASLRVSFAVADIATVWRIPGAILLDSYVVVKVLLRDLFSRKRAGSYYRVCGFKTSKRDPLIVGRCVLATWYTTATPNAIVIGIDETQSRMLLHQLERSGASRLDRSLGAQC